MSEYTFGHILYTNRKRRGISIEQATKATKIRAQILEAFEQSDFDRMPPKGYAQGMLTSYARYLGLPARSVLDDYFRDLDDYEHRQQNPEPIQNNGNQSSRLAFTAQNNDAVGYSGVSIPMPRSSSRYTERPSSLGNREGNYHNSVSLPYNRNTRENSSRRPLPQTYDDFVSARGNNEYDSYTRNRNREVDAYASTRQNPRDVSYYNERGRDERSSLRGYSRDISSSESRDYRSTRKPRRVINSNIFDERNENFATDDHIIDEEFNREKFSSRRGSTSDRDYGSSRNRGSNITRESSRERSYERSSREQTVARTTARERFENADRQARDRADLRERDARGDGNRSSRGSSSPSRRNTSSRATAKEYKQNYRKLLYVLLGILVVGIISFALVKIFGSSDENVTTVPVISDLDNSSDGSSSSSGSKKNSSTNSEGAEAFEIEFSLAKGESSWISITVDGTSVVSDTIVGPESFTFTASDSVQATIGKPTAVTVKVNGNDYDLSSSSGVGKLDISAADAPAKVVTEEEENEESSDNEETEDSASSSEE